MRILRTSERAGFLRLELKTTLVRKAAVAFLATTTSVLPLAAHADTCQSALPQSLSAALTRNFHGYRIPLEYDNAPQDIQNSALNGGEPCLGVGSAEFLGDHKKDYVVAMTSSRGDGGIAVIAMPVKGGWHLQKLETWPEHSRSSKYVAVGRPGHYTRMQGATAALQAEERESLDCPNAGAIVGTVGVQRMLYCYTQGRWLHVQVPE